MNEQKNLENLAIRWKIAKDAETKAAEQRKAVEEEIIQATNGEKKFFSLGISYGETRSYDQEGLEKVKSIVKPEFFPFKTDYKEVKKDMDAIQKMHPDLFDQHYAPLLTIKPKKPSFTYKGE
jgi:hypothetical protein